MWRRDRAIETEARMHVRSILRQMAEYPPAGEYDESAKGGLSVSGLLRVLMARFNSLFRRETTIDEEDGTSAFYADSDRATERAASSSSASSGKNEGEYRRMALAISEGLSSNENGSSHVGPATYTVISWGAALYLLSVIHDILLLSGNTRNDVRWWLYQSRQSFGSGDGGGGGSNAIGPGAEVDVGSGGTATAALHPRIEGLTATGHSFRWNVFDRKDALRTANFRYSNDWDPMTMTPLVNLFFELLVGLMKGNVLELSDCPNTPTGIDFSDSKSERTLVQVIQLKAIDLVLALMSDAPPYDHAQDDHSNRTPYLWKFLFESLILSDRSSRPSLEALPIGDFFSPWEKRDIYCGNYLLGSGRIHSTKLLTDSHAPNEQNKRGAEKQGHAGNKPSRANSTSESSRYIGGNSKLHWHLSILVKDRILQLLSHFVLSSSSVNQSLYRILDGGTKTSFAKRILAAILDQMDEYIVPYLSSGPSSDVRAAKLSADRCLRLCYRCIQFLLIMSRSNEGIRLLRLQMRIESNEDEPSRWSQSSIGCMTAVLNGILSFAMQVEEMENTQLKSTDFARLLTLIVGQCIAFFKSLLLFVEQQRKSSPKSTTFLVLTSEHRTIFQSCCQRILSHKSPNKVSDPPRSLHISEGLKYDVRCILEEFIDVDGHS
ncbi:hypothetical protein ACHAW5_002676 [Stephanodiscus triporus]|uniref:Uncharacterized protein n=1 Tax=Stephanodiscus triporus TaxID=2934178 RepID=A0ABD3NE88_9STRA